jgi:hypothetical protein
MGMHIVVAHLSIALSVTMHGNKLSDKATWEDCATVSCCKSHTHLHLLLSQGDGEVLPDAEDQRPVDAQLASQLGLRSSTRL